MRNRAKGRVVLIQRVAHHAEIAQRLGVVRVDAQGLLERLDGLVRALFFQQHRAEVAEGFHMLRVGGDGLAIPIHRLVRLLARAADAAHVVERRRELRVERQRLALTGFGTVVILAVVTGDAQIAMGRHHARIECHRPFAMPERVVESSGLAVHLAEVGVEQRDVAVVLDGLLDQVDGESRLAGLMRNDAQQVQGIRMLRLHLQYLAQHALRLRQPAL